MLFLRSWLQEYIDLNDYTDAQLSDLISLKSGECEEINLIQDYFGGKVVLGRIANLRKHPDADTLNVFDVYLNSDGSNKVQIVSAAPNAREGLIVPVALDGAKLPSMTILAKKMRGLESQGMCCGKSELALETQFSSGLWEVEGDLVSGTSPDSILGKSVCKVFPDLFPVQTTFEIKYLQDKLASCSNYLGLALELAKCLEDSSRLQGLAKSIYDHKNSDVLELSSSLLNRIQAIPFTTSTTKLEDKTGLIKNYTLLNLKSPTEFTLPHGLQTKMFLTNKNLVGGMADLSNYLLFDIGQPSHFFSQSKINLSQLTFSQISGNEEFQGLGNLKKTTLNQGLTVLKDGDDKTIIVPGVCGSMDTKSETNDKECIVEITDFEPSLIARNSFAVNYRSDSSKVFASGINKELQLVFINKLLEINEQYNCGLSLEFLLLWSKGKDYSQSYDNVQNWISSNNFGERSTLSFGLNQIINRLDGRTLEYWKPILLDKLNNLGEVEVSNEIQILLKINPFYSQITTVEDVIFELSKLIGFENLEREYLSFDQESKTNETFGEINNLKAVFVNAGFCEVLTRPFVFEKDLMSSLTNTPKLALEALSSQRQDQPWLRDSLFSSLMITIAKNINLGYKDPQVFETSKIYSFQKPNDSDSIFWHAIEDKNTRSTQNSKTYENYRLEAISTVGDNYNFTTLINSLCNKLGFSLENLNTDKQLKITELKDNIMGEGYSYNLGQTMEIELIQVSNKIKKHFEIPLIKPIWWIKISYNPELLKINTYLRYYEQSDYNNISRTISLIIPKSLRLEIIQKIQISLDFYFDSRMNGIERISHNDSQDIINLNFNFVSYSRTLTTVEIEEYLGKLIQECKKISDGVELR